MSTKLPLDKETLTVLAPREAEQVDSAGGTVCPPGTSNLTTAQERVVTQRQ